MHRFTFHGSICKATRGLDVALVERDDFAQGTSSKSTKLVHGGVRYLEKAILKADKEQFALVHEGLRERGYLLRNAPHLAHPVQLMTRPHCPSPTPRVHSD